MCLEAGQEHRLHACVEEQPRRQMVGNAADVPVKQSGTAKSLASRRLFLRACRGDTADQGTRDVAVVCGGVQRWPLLGATPAVSNAKASRLREAARTWWSLLEWQRRGRSPSRLFLRIALQYLENRGVVPAPNRADSFRPRGKEAQRLGCSVFRTQRTARSLLHHAQRHGTQSRRRWHSSSHFGRGRVWARVCVVTQPVLSAALAVTLASASRNAAPPQPADHP